MNPVYYDASYLLKLQIVESGTIEVRGHASTVREIHSAHHGRAEFASAAFRKVREGVAAPADFQRLMTQFHADCLSGTILLLPLTDTILDRVDSIFATAPVTVYLRAADALHLPPPPNTDSPRFTPTTPTSSPPPRSSACAG